MSMLPGVDLTLVESVDEAHAFMQWLGERREGALGIDTETTGLDWWTSDFLRLVQIGDSMHGWAFDARKWLGVVEEALVRYEGRWSFHNRNFDLHALESAGLPLPPLHRTDDSMILDHLLEPNRPHGLKAASERYWPGSMAGAGLLDVVKRRNKWTWATIPVTEFAYWGYGALDPVLTSRLVETELAELRSDPALVAAYEREMAVQDMAYDMERRGVLIDMEYTARLREQWDAEATQLRESLARFGVNNPGSKAQILAVLDLQIPSWEPDEWTPSGEIKLDAKVLRGLDHQIATDLLRFKRIEKWVSSYLDPFLEFGPVIHPDIRTLKAKTGRQAVGRPPFQQLPARAPEIRDCVVAGEGHVLLAVDYDGQELRVIADRSKEPALLQAFREGIDPHTTAASLVYGVPFDQVSKSQRVISKNTQYGIAYGAGPRKIAGTAGVPVSEAQRFYSTYMERFSGVKTFLATGERLGRERLARDGRAWVRTLGGRINTVDPDKLYRMVNSYVQGSCADVLKMKMVELDAAGISEYFMLAVHDELLYRVPVDDFEEIRHEAARIMPDTESYSIPLTVHASAPLTRWGDTLRENT